MTVVWLVIFAVAMGYATFIENDYGTPAARDLVYDARWFEILMVLIAINFLGNIARYKLWSKEKWGIFLFHIAFVVTIAGAFVTRYIGYEGTVNIREGSSSNQLITQQKYLRASLVANGKTYSWNKSLSLSVFSDFNKEYSIGNKEDEVEVKGVRFIPDAVKALAKSTPDAVVFELAVANEQGRRDLFLPYGEQLNIDGHTLSIGEEGADVTILSTDTGYLIQSKTELDHMSMATQMAGTVKADSVIRLQTGTLYTNRKLSIVVKGIHEGKKVVWETIQEAEMKGKGQEVVEVEVVGKGEKKRCFLPARSGMESPPVTLALGKSILNLSYGSVALEMPFYLYLEDFELKRYPGSASPSEYSSKVVVNDKDVQMPYTIFMNNVLDYRGYRFFQASYDTDEKGTVLSVNHDQWGTNITYLGYFLMILGMFGTLFSKRSRFAALNKQLKSLKQKKYAHLTLLFFFFSIGTIAQKVDIDKVLEKYHPVPEKHAFAFGELLIQDMDGRIKPINSLASEFMRKLMRSTSFRYQSGEKELKLNANQLFLAMHKDPVMWQYLPLIKVDKDKAARILDSLDVEGNRLAFIDFLTVAGDYKLSGWVERANRLKPSMRNEEDKELLKMDERFNILYNALVGNYLRIFPKKSEANNTWFTDKDRGVGFTNEDSLFVYHILPTYYQAIDRANQSGDWNEAEQHLSYIKTYQDIIAKDIVPSEGRRKAEIWYNKARLFIWLFPAYWTVGLVLLIIAILRIFFLENKWLKWSYRGLVGAVVLCFLLQTVNMIVRWYAGGYPPWSNGYEMTLLVAWALVLFGILFSRKTDFIVPLSALFTGTLLFVAFLDWLNPEITNLVPVLKSYWLKIHVAVIVGSYAPLALSALLGLTAMGLMIANRKNNLRMHDSIKELTALNEISMIIGTFLLTIGTFLGGVWANESWGRYWGWDPKETWALISIIVYAAVLHFRLIPKLNNSYLFSISSVVAFFSIIMTSYGVNYYLSGMHSYAKGDPVPIPTFVYYVVTLIFIVGIWAYFSWKKQAKKM